MMQKIGLIIFGSLIGLTFSFLLSALNSNALTIIAANETQKTISMFTIQIDDREFSIKNIKKGTDKRLMIPINGENSYRVNVILDSGEILVGDGRYVEQGYVIYEFIRPNEIEHRIRSF